MMAARSPSDCTIPGLVARTAKAIGAGDCGELATLARIKSTWGYVALLEAGFSGAIHLQTRIIEVNITVIATPLEDHVQVSHRAFRQPNSIRILY